VSVSEAQPQNRPAAEVPPPVFFTKLGRKSTEKKPSPQKKTGPDDPTTA
jgi:hypothetical protein